MTNLLIALAGLFILSLALAPIIGAGCAAVSQSRPAANVGISPDTLTAHSATAGRYGDCAQTRRAISEKLTENTRPNVF